MTSSIRTTVHESLPYIDTDPTPAERAAAEALIATELSSSSTTTTTTTSTSPPQSPSPSPSTSSHPSLPPFSPLTFTPLIHAELSRTASSTPLTAIDPSRYEIQDPLPSNNNNNSTPSSLAGPLSLAYATHTYLQGRETHLRLLDAYGKNAWLVGNWQAEAELAALERDLAAARREIDVVNIQRRRLQDEVGEELRGLEETWKKGIGRVLETEAATEALRRQVLEKQRSSA
ncbi:Pre-mRNA-splicing factor SPF27 [Xylaria longipes]|nr:Pre-mRNA-splicing factor SPF27 [Xylaria longipes]